MSRTARGIELLPDSLARPEHRLVITAHQRKPSRLDDIVVDPIPPDPSPDELATLVDAVHADGVLWICGGEPTLRSDLPALIEMLARRWQGAVGLATDGLALTGEPSIEPLRKAGLTRVRIPLHGSEPAAHDWLIRQPGAARRAIRAARSCRAAGLAVEMEATITRPAVPHLARLCELAAHLGISALHLRALTARGPAAEWFVGLSPRLALLESALEELGQAALRRRLPIAVHGLPRCAAKLLDPCRVNADMIRWVVAEGAPWQPYRDALEPPAAGGRCPACPGAPECPGASEGYIEHFGLAELASEDGLSIQPPRSRPRQRPRPTAVPPPAARAGRAPVTRLAAMIQQLEVEPRGDPLAPRPAVHQPDVLRIAFGSPARVACPVCGDGSASAAPEPTRAIRKRLVRAAGEGADVLRIASAGTLCHPEAPALLGETKLLRFARVEVAAEGSRLDELTAAELQALSGLQRVDVALYGPTPQQHDEHTHRPGSWAATVRGLKRLSEVVGVPTGAYAVLHDERDVARYAEAWEAGELPGRPAFRLSPRGSSLEALAQTVAALPACAARRALVALLPACLRPEGTDAAAMVSSGVAFDEAQQPAQRPSGSDRYGWFTPCACDGDLRALCPGLAEGWTFEGAPPAAAASSGQRRS